MNRVTSTFIVSIMIMFTLISETANSTSEYTYSSNVSETLSTTSTSSNSSLKTFFTTASVHVFTPNASTVLVEAEEVQVEVIVHGQESNLKKIRPVLILSGAFIAAFFLIIFRNKLRRRK